MVDGRYIPRSLINQQYLYCIPFYEKYKSYPKYLAFNMFRIQDWYTVEFNQSDFDKAKQWLLILLMIFIMKYSGNQQVRKMSFFANIYVVVLHHVSIVKSILNKEGDTNC
jgi:hypothetical protein